LVVDDESDIVQVLRFGLEAAGYIVESAADGQEGLRKARELEPDLILLDLMLPKLDGYKVCRLLKFDERYRHIPIVILSARNQGKDKELAMETGANSFLTKPQKFSDLLAHIEALLKSGSTRAAPRRPALGLVPRPDVDNE
jgi:DNA-binding response OmpR family regulator